MQLMFFVAVGATVVLAVFAGNENASSWPD
jgi:hypothetical protein